MSNADLTFLSLLVFVTDTWLHLTTTSENIFHYSPSPGTNMSVGLLPRCLVNNNSYTAQSDFYGPDSGPACTLNPAATNVFLVESPIQPIEVLNNVSAVVVAKGHSADGRTYQYLSPSDTADHMRQDYTAATYAMSSRCAPRSTICGLGVGEFGAATPFNCTGSGFASGISNLIQLQYYLSPGFLDTDIETHGFANPFYLLGAAFLPSQWPLPDHDAEIVTETHGDHAVVFSCATTVFDVTYRLANGSVTDFRATPSNISVTNALQSPIGYTRGASYQLSQAFSIAAGAASTAQDMLDQWAVQYDRAAMAMAVTALQGAPALAAQYRDEVIVARVPVAPLVCLLAVNLLYTAVGVVLVLMAAVAARDGDTHEVVERMSVLGLAAAALEPDRYACRPVEEPEKMFRELSEGSTDRVVITRSAEGGFEFQPY